MTSRASADDPIRIGIGDVLCGRYRAEKVIGRSETGLVVEATDLLRGGGVAIKMLEPAADEVDLLTARLRREAHVLAQLTSPHVIRVFGVEKERSMVCLIMELLKGGTLAEVVRARGPLPIDEAVGYIVQACDGVAEAHSLGIVHRDLKPQNMFAVSQPDGTSVLKVLDFGVSKQSGGGGMGLTATGAALGSPLYTAVEQFRDASRVDSRADIWSLGLVLYFLLCRRNGFDADNPIALMLKIATSPPAPLRERRPDVPPELEAVVLQCVEKDPNRRFQSVLALARALAPFGPAWVPSYLPSIEARSVRKSLPSLPRIDSIPPPAPGPASSPKPAASTHAPTSNRQNPVNAVPALPPVVEPASTCQVQPLALKPASLEATVKAGPLVSHLQSPGVSPPPMMYAGPPPETSTIPWRTALIVVVVIFAVGALVLAGAWVFLSP
ncbi:MAG: protein kinase [Polyangiaceae bacterium]|nr:protein kinase [Polyangiaceae bacterium]